jgi:hypothetical protein
VTLRRAIGSLWSNSLWLCLALGCGTPMTQPDADAGGQGDAWSVPGIPGTVLLLAPSTEGPSAPVDLFALRINEIQLVGDRGPASDPRVPGPGLVTVDESGLEVPVGDVPPALYSAVVLTLAAGPADVGQPVLELRLTLEHGPTLDIATAEPLELTARCEHGAVVSTTGQVRMGVDFALAEAVAIVFTDPLPAPDGAGVIRIDEATTPAAIADFRAMLTARIHAECNADGT